MHREYLQEFISIYENEPRLWLLKSKDYHNKIKKEKAYEKLVEKLQEIEPNATKDSVIVQPLIHELRSRRLFRSGTWSELKETVRKIVACVATIYVQVNLKEYPQTFSLRFICTYVPFKHPLHPPLSWYNGTLALS